MATRITLDTLCALDPGVTMSAWALFRGKRLADAGLVRSNKTLDREDRAHVQLSALLVMRNQLCPNGFATVIVELPMVYPGANQIGDPNDMMALAYAAGALAHGIASEDTRMMAPTAQRWKGQVPKDVHHRRLADNNPRAVPIVNRAAPPSLRHHVWDAVGLGYWQIERTLE